MQSLALRMPGRQSQDGIELEALLLPAGCNPKGAVIGVLLQSRCPHTGLCNLLACVTCCHAQASRGRASLLGTICVGSTRKGFLPLPGGCALKLLRACQAHPHLRDQVPTVLLQTVQTLASLCCFLHVVSHDSGGAEQSVLTPQLLPPHAGCIRSMMLCSSLPPSEGAKLLPPSACCLPLL